MTTRAKPINDYEQLAARFGVVRRAWKRAAALSGLAIVATESIGIFTALLFLDWLYQPLPAIRIGMWAVALAVIAYFFVRHVIKPLGRKISDEQIALYIEEHRTELDGVLITAAEFGRNRAKLAGSQAALIDAVVHEAATRSARTQVSRVVDFSRLRKYGIGAVACIGLYLVLSVLFPNIVGHRIGRVLEPWFATEEDKARHNAAAVQAEPIRITLSKQNTSLPRGTSFDFEATLSKPKPAEQAVVLYFRPRTAGAEWQKLAMPELEKLNGFQGLLPDVSEDLEFYVACGNAKSDTYKLAVYDPLIVQSLEMATHYPDYVKQPDLIEKPSTGDVTALTGSKATLRILTSTPLKEGTIKWSNGQTQSVTIDSQSTSTATVSFEVNKDDTYDYTLTDVNGQQAVSAAPLTVHAIPDTPPTLAVKSPQSPVLTHMLGEVNFQVEADDDFGVEGIDLVYSRLDAQGQPQETRLPLTLVSADAKDAPHAVTASYQLALEDAKPPFQANDAISYHLEARDAKGQKAISEIGFIIVGYFEHWATWSTPEISAHVHDDTGADLMALMALVWDINNQKPHLTTDELQKQSTEVASKMVDAQGEVVSLFDLAEMPQLTKVAPAIIAHVKKAHDALVTTDTATAVTEMSVAAALYSGYAIKEDSGLKLDPASQAAVGSHAQSPSITMLEQARLNTLADATKDKTHEEQDKAQSEAAAAAAKRVAELLKQQDALIAKAQAESASAPQSQQGSEEKKDQSPMPSAGASGHGGGGQGSASVAKEAQQAADLAAAQHDVADKTKAAAAQAKSSATGTSPDSKLQQAGDKTAAAAKMMEEAARDFAAGKTGEGQAKASEAKTTLQEAGNTLQNTDRDKLEAAISNAESHAAVLLEKQQDLGADTGSLAKDLGDKKPDQRQQRDLQKQAYRQTELGAAAESLNSEINNLSDWAAKAGEPLAIHALTDAQHTIKRAQPQAKMSNAVIDLNNASPSTAADEQKNAQDALKKIVENLQASSDALAASREAQLNRANRAAQDAKKNLDVLLAQAGIKAKSAEGKGEQAKAGTDAGAQAKAGTEAGAQAKAGTEAGAQAKAGTEAGAQAKAGTEAGAQAKAGTEAGAQAKAGTEAGAQAKAGTEAGAEAKAGTEAGAQAKAGTEAGAQAKAGTEAGAQAKAGTEAGAQAKAGSEAGAQAKAGGQPEAQAQAGGEAGNGGGDEVRKLAYNLTQLTAAIDNRQLIPQDEIDQLKQMSMDKAELEKKLAVDPKFLQDVSGIVARISDKIEAEMEAKTEAGKLFSSQREECPPIYRQFVNKYFEALSQVAPAPGQGNKPEQPAQP